MRELRFPVPITDALVAVLVTSCLSLQVRAQSIEFADGVEAGQITKNDLAEVSGLTASRSNPGVLWVHNDQSRDSVYAVSTNGQILATYRLGEDVNDFEDIAMGPGPEPELQYLYCGDIGDNSATRSSIRVYRAAEPAVYAYFAANPISENFPLVERVTLTYPDGSYNAEALMIDPLTGDLYLATKQRNITRLYRAARSQLQDKATVVLTFAGQLDFDEVSAGDISPDGREILLRQENFARLWRRPPGQDVAEALAGEAVEVPVIGMPTEPNGEGVAFHAGGLGYYTVSEGAKPAIYFFAKTVGSVPPQPRILIPPGSAWKYLDNGSDQGTAWRAPAFSDAAWRSGAAQLGYGDDDQRTEISFGSDKDVKHLTTYFRNKFMVENPVALGDLTVRLVFDDGVAVFLNGAEVLRRNLPANAAFSEAALAPGGSLENLWQSFAITNVLQPGTNTVAVEVHRRSRSENDLSFDLQLLAAAPEERLRFTGPPRRVSAGAWALDFQGPVGGAVIVEASSALANWSHLGSVALVNGQGSFTNTVPTGTAWNFYRLRQ